MLGAHLHFSQWPSPRQVSLDHVPRGPRGLLEACDGPVSSGTLQPNESSRLVFSVLVSFSQRAMSLPARLCAFLESMA